jgi:AcrR family transcriptional regulator
VTVSSANTRERLSKGDRARERVLDAVVEAVGSRGLADLSIADIGEAAGMSAGHVMYYFGTKDALFVEALRHSERLREAPRAALLARASTPAQTLRRYVALYLPEAERDARWSLWLEVWNQSLTRPELTSVQLELDARWQLDLDAIVRSGVDAGDFRVADVGGAVETVSSLLDGVAVRMVTGTPGLSRRKALKIANAACAALLGATSS